MIRFQLLRQPVLVMLIGNLLALNCAFPQEAAQIQTVTFQTDDGITLYGDLYTMNEDRDVPVILLFHQGASNARAEYSTIAGRLLEAGYTVLAIDQRRGGSRLGGVNRTVQALNEREFSYCEAYADLEAALTYMTSQGYTSKFIAWGSSYSAALALKLAAAHPEKISGVLAFSPATGEPMAGCEPYRYVNELKIPALVLHPAQEIHYEHLAEQLGLFREHGLEIYIAQDGVHGSSMLNPSRVKGDIEPNWKAVMDFLYRLKVQ